MQQSAERFLSFTPKVAGGRILFDAPAVLCDVRDAYEALQTCAGQCFTNLARMACRWDPAP